MQRQTINIIVFVGLSLSLVVLISGMNSWRLFDNQQGYSPEQPIAFSHRLHAGEMGIDCRFCHASADKSRHAGIPSTDVCMKCHKVVTAPYQMVRNEMDQAEKENRQPKTVVSDELRKLYTAFGLDEDLNPDPDKTPQPIDWVRIHDLPDYVYFDHRAHVAANVSCQKCHGPVESMERMRQSSSLSMGWCINCHRESNATGIDRPSIDGHAANASLDCATCHY